MHCTQIGLLHSLILLFVMRAVYACYEADNIDISINVPVNAQINPVCKTVGLGAEDIYITRFDPHADMNTAIQMVLYGCEAAQTTPHTWDCTTAAPCVGNLQVIYSWGRNAPILKLPEGVAFHIGGSSQVKYLVLQVYRHIRDDNPNLTDYSGVILHTTCTRPQYLAGTMVLDFGNAGTIPPHVEAWHANVSKVFNGPSSINPFAFRVHANKLGTVITGYRVRNSQWTLIGKGDPQKPQAFYPVLNPVEVKEGDILVVRCTYNTMNRDRETYFGSGTDDEKCVFYLMFYTDVDTGK